MCTIIIHYNSTSISLSLSVSRFLSLTLSLSLSLSLYLSSPFPGNSGGTAVGSLALQPAASESAPQPTQPLHPTSISGLCQSMSK